MKVDEKSSMICYVWISTNIYELKSKCYGSPPNGKPHFG